MSIRMYFMFVYHRMPVKLYVSHFVYMVDMVDMGDRRLEMVTIYSFGRIEPSNSSKIYLNVNLVRR